MSSSEFWQLALSAAGALIALCTGIFVWIQASRHFRYSRSAAYIERFNSPDYVEARLVVEKLSSTDPNFDAAVAAELGNESEFDERARLQILMFANIFQELGAALRAGIVDECYTWQVFGYLSQHYWQTIGRFVIRLRDLRDRPTLWEDFQGLAIEMSTTLDTKYLTRRGSTPIRPLPQAYIFGYGSLLNLKSASKTAGRELTASELIPARLYGYRRSWTASDDVMFEGEEGSLPIVFLDLARQKGEYCNGVLIPVDEHILKRLDVREKNYDRVDVTAFVAPSETTEPVIACPVATYISKAHVAVPDHAVFAEQYEALVNDGLATWGEEFTAEFARTTTPSELPRKSGRYKFLSVEQNRVSGRD